MPASTVPFPCRVLARCKSIKESHLGSFMASYLICADMEFGAKLPYWNSSRDEPHHRIAHAI
jgi:hypothetical protein